MLKTALKASFEEFVLEIKGHSIYSPPKQPLPGVSYLCWGVRLRVRMWGPHRLVSVRSSVSA